MGMISKYNVVCLKIKIRNNVRDFDLNVLMNAYDIGHFSQSVDELKYLDIPMIRILLSMLIKAKRHAL